MPQPPKKRVLIVDDEHIIADTLVTIFTNVGIEARAAYSAEQALDLLPHWTPQYAILDDRLPGINGVDLAIRIKAEHPTCEVTLFSGQSSSGPLVAAAQKDGHLFEILSKPVHPNEFLRRLTPDPRKK
jgi:DNA-binding NtrC family response regulator